MDTQLIESVIALEWEMFSFVPNKGRRVACQMDPQTFRIMRHSQECDWPDELLLSYRDDLIAAREAGRNLMTEKYAWMMESTFPDEFQSMAHLLRSPDNVSLGMIEEIVAVHVYWKLAMRTAYPKLSGKGRVVRSDDDSPYQTSFETYLRGELKTYSAATIALLHDFTMRWKEEGINGVERDLFNQVRHYGFSSLRHAEESQEG